MHNLIDYIKDLDYKLQVVIYSLTTTIATLILKSILNNFYNKRFLNHKLNKEYDFSQKKKIKEELALTKTHLIKASEELNYRLWNLSNNIDKRWHNIPETEWKDIDKYYLRSFTYRFLVFLYWVIKAENSMYNFDISKADKSDKQYLKHIKSLKHFFCEGSMLKELGYTSSCSSNHFYKDDLIKYISYIETNNNLINYMDFENKYLTSCNNISKVIEYINKIESDANNLNYNIVKSFHVFLMIFLNKYGLDYHKTSKNKIKEITSDKYKDLKIKKGLCDFLVRNKMLNESKLIIKYFKLKEELLPTSGFATKWYIPLIIKHLPLWLARAKSEGQFWV